MSQHFGFYRAKVINNRDQKSFGRVLIWIPDLMPDIPDNEGIWAYPANNPIGGRNTQFEDDNHYMGTSYIPRKGSWVFVFFECGNINRPFYFGSVNIEQSKVLPENQVGSNPSDKWVLFKSHEGRTVVLSDDSSDARVEITGKKQKLASPPSGDTGSVYTIDGNQTTILLDERSGKDKLLIRTHKGDFIHIDIDDRKLQASFEGDIIIKTNGKFQLTAGDNIDIKSVSSDVNIQGEGNINLKSSSSINQQGGGNINIKSGDVMNITAGGVFNGLAGGVMNLDGQTLNEQSGSAANATDASDATQASPVGERNT